MPAIVSVNVYQVQAPTPPTLQQTGAFVSQGATDLAPGTFSLLTQLSSLTPILNGALALTSITYASGVATATATVAHGFTVGDTIQLTIAGATPLEYNGTFMCSITGTTTFIYFPPNPGGSASIAPGSVAISYTVEDVSELYNQANTFFAQGSQVAVYVLELGPGNAADGVVALTNYITMNPNSAYTPGAAGYFYAYLVPAGWSNEPTFISMLADYESTTAKTYFFITATLANYMSFTDLMKDAVVLIPTPSTGNVTWQKNALTATTCVGSGYATNATTVAAAGTAYIPGSTLTTTGNTGTEPTFVINTTKVVTVTMNADGTGGTNGATVLTGTTGTGTRFQCSATITAGAISAIGSITVAGSYSTNPTSLTAEPVTNTDGTLTGATVTLAMGVLAVTVATEGLVGVAGSNPQTTTVSPSGGTGCTLDVAWSNGSVTFTTTTNHGVPVGAWFQILGEVPTGYNGYYQALAGTNGSTLVASLSTNPGSITTEGYLQPQYVATAGEAPNEFTHAADFWRALSYAPSSTNKVAPFAFSYTYGTTPWPTWSNLALLTTLKNASINYIGTGSEGGITNTALFWGTTMDARDFTYWYSVDFAQINSQINLANAVINGSNNPVSPLYYSQDGVNRLQDVIVATMNTCVQVGLANTAVPIVATTLSGQDFDNAINAGTYDGQIVVNAVPFLEYLAVNPGDYKIGRYAGFSAQYIPNRGFISIVFNLFVTDFLAP